MYYFNMNQQQSITDKLSSGVISQERELILFNDDVNTFEFVIQTLIDVCEHEPEQAEQCAMIAHFKGKCGVKKGAFDLLKSKHRKMSDAGLTVEIM